MPNLLLSLLRGVSQYQDQTSPQRQLEKNLPLLDLLSKIQSIKKGQLEGEKIPLEMEKIKSDIETARQRRENIPKLLSIDEESSVAGKLGLSPSEVSKQGVKYTRPPKLNKAPKVAADKTAEARTNKALADIEKEKGVKDYLSARPQERESLRKHLYLYHSGKTPKVPKLNISRQGGVFGGNVIDITPEY